MTKGAARAKLDQSFSRLLDRDRDESLYLGVIGEFSSGKSTLINALLRTDVLKEDVLQGTTCAPTLIRHGSLFDVVVYFRNGSEKRYCGFWDRLIQRIPLLRPQLGTLMDRSASFLHRYTATEKYARLVERIEVSLPVKCTIFDAGIVLVDTPGINSDNPRHTEITRDAIDDICDTSLVITPASASCSEPLLRFLSENLADVQHRCMAVITKMDSLRKPEDRERQVGFVMRKLGNGSSIHIPGVYPVAAYCMVPGRKRDLTTQQVKELKSHQKSFKYFEKSVCTRITKARKEIIRERIGGIIRDSLLPNLQTVIGAQKMTLENRVDAIERNKVVDIDDFLQGIMTRELSAMRELDSLGENTDSVCERLKDELIRKLQSTIDSATNAKALESIVAPESVRKICGAFFKRVNQTLAKVCQPAARQTQAATERLFAEFNQAYSRVAASMSTADKSSFAPPEAIGPPRGLQYSIPGVFRKGKVYSLVLILFMVVNLTVTLGPVGGILGFGLAYAINFIFSPSLAKRKKIATEAVSAWIDTWYGEVVDDFKNAIDAYVKNQVRAFRQMVDTCRSHRTTVNKVIEAQDSERKSVNSDMAQVKLDLEKLHSIQRAIEQDIF